jgi:hypothetical protein
VPGNRSLALDSSADCRTGAADGMEKVDVMDAESDHPTSPTREKLPCSTD